MGCGASTRADDDFVVGDSPRFKISLVGPPSVGKTSVARRFVTNSYPREYKPDTMVDIGVKIIDMPDTLSMATVEVWTYPGESDVDIEKPELVESDAWMLVVDASTPFLSDLLDREYADKVQKHMDALGPVPLCGLPLMVVVTHMDVVNTQPQLFVSVQQSVVTWADEHHALAAFVSAVTNEGIHKAFRALALRADTVKRTLQTSLSQPQGVLVPKSSRGRMSA